MMNVIGIGDNVVDKYVHTQTMYPGGNALNFAAYAAMLGHNAAYLGIFGNDAAAEHVMQVLDKVGVKWPHCLQVAGENGCAQLKIEGRTDISWFERRGYSQDNFDGFYFSA